MLVLSSYPFWDAMWTMAVFFAWVIWIALIVMTLVDLFGRHDLSGWGKAAWTLLIIVLPLIGVLTYMIARPPEDRVRIA